jgi:hypothetical protein
MGSSAMAALLATMVIRVLLDAPYDLGLHFSDMWSAAVGFLTGDMLKPMAMAMGGLLIAVLAIKRLVDIIWGH